MKKFLLAIVFGTSAFLISGMWARSAHAVFIVDIEQVGPEVAITGSGNLNLSGLSFDFSEIEAGLIDPRVGELVLAGRTQFVPLDFYGSFSGPNSFGPGFASFLPEVTGDVVGIEPNPGGGPPSFILEVPAGYMSGAPLADSAIFLGTLAGLGVTPGTYTYNLGVDSFVINIGTTPVPAALPLFASGLGVLGLLGWRRKKKAKAFLA